jgi:hypothetical protein
VTYFAAGDVKTSKTALQIPIADLSTEQGGSYGDSAIWGRLAYQRLRRLQPEIANTLLKVT